MIKIEMHEREMLLLIMLLLLKMVNIQKTVHEMVALWDEQNKRKAKSKKKQIKRDQ